MKRTVINTGTIDSLNEIIKEAEKNMEGAGEVNVKQVVPIEKNSMAKWIFCMIIEFTSTKEEKKESKFKKEK